MLALFLSVWQATLDPAVDHFHHCTEHAFERRLRQRHTWTVDLLAPRCVPYVHRLHEGVCPLFPGSTCSGCCATAAPALAVAQLMQCAGMCGASGGALRYVLA